MFAAEGINGSKIFLNNLLPGTLQFVKELSNITKNSGETIKLRCEVKQITLNSSNQKVQFEWLQNSAPIIKGKRFKIGKRKVLTDLQL